MCRGTRRRRLPARAPPSSRSRPRRPHPPQSGTGEPDDLSVESRGSAMPPSGFHRDAAGVPADRLHMVEVWTPGGTGPVPAAQATSTTSRARRNWRRPTTTVCGIGQTDGQFSGCTAPSGTSNWMRSFVTATSAHPWGITRRCGTRPRLYYLNVLAGPAPERTLQAREDQLSPSCGPAGEHRPGPRVPLVPGTRAVAGAGRQLGRTP